MTFGEYLDRVVKQAQEEARHGLEFSGKTWHGYYAYHNELDKMPASTKINHT